MATKQTAQKGAAQAPASQDEPAKTAPAAPVTDARGLLVLDYGPLKKGSEIRDRYDGKTFRVRVLPEVTGWESLVAAFRRVTDPAQSESEQATAVRDMFNGAYRLAQQKAGKDSMNEQTGEGDAKKYVNPSDSEVQKVIDAFLVRPATRSKGESKKVIVAAKAERMDRLESKAAERIARVRALKDSDPARYAVEVELLRDMDLLPADFEA